MLCGLECVLCIFRNDCEGAVTTFKIVTRRVCPGETWNCGCTRHGRLGHISGRTDFHDHLTSRFRQAGTVEYSGYDIKFKVYSVLTVTVLNTVRGTASSQYSINYGVQ